MARKLRDPDMNMSNKVFDEALARLLQTKPEELPESLRADMLQKQVEVRERIKARLREIDDGGRPKRGRFRL